MAVSRKDCTNVIFLHVIFLVALNIIHNPKLVHGDSTLIDSVCRDTPFPIDCHNCFGSNPLSSQADVKGLAGIAINCLYAPATDVDNLLRTYTTYGQSQYAFCLQQFDSIVQNLSLALQSWKNNQYRDSQNLLEKATIHNPKFVNGDVTLIRHICREIAYPVDCNNCLDSNPLSSRADVKGLAGIAINCSYAIAIDVDNQLRELTGYSQYQYTFCLQQFDSIVQNPSQALQSCKNNQYRDSRNLLGKALVAYFKCLKSLNKPSDLSRHAFCCSSQNQNFFSEFFWSPCTD
ncbi:hypothetical protein RHMOL_Rhmol01G0031700 [Rhododendron molle]|uniref:Uncharacterized protein n=1 Tax=Rhododendron molle TaxID=49168 RepID=A0ACC0PY54_RHOML|nr:hypothetical protein RHMOL_Rhmol01G0031700 [Rhododendron molle]